MDEQNTQPNEPRGGSNATKWIIGIIVVALVVWGISASRKKTGEQATNTKTEGETYKIGVILPLTGDAAVYGEPGRNVVQLAVEEINNNGGVNGKKIDIIFEDGKCNGKDGANAAQKLVNVDKVQAIIGGFCSSETLAAIPMAEAGKVVVLSPSASSPKLTGVSPYFFRNYPSDNAQGKVLAEVANKKGYKTVAFIVENKDYPLGIYGAFDARFKELGGKTIKEEFAPDISDFRSVIAKVRAANPDALFLDTQAPAAIERILKQVQEANWKPQLFVDDILPGDPDTVTRNKTVLEGALTAEFGTDPSNSKFQHLLDAYKQKYGKGLNYQGYMQCVYDAVYMLKDAIAQVGYDGEKIAQWSRTVKDWPGASGKITIGSDGDIAGGHRAEVIKNGKVEVYSE